MNASAKSVIDALGLAPHPEGGYFRETYRSSEEIPATALPARFSGPRAFSTAIYFLLTGHTFSALHRLRADEVWHFYAGGPLTLFTLDDSGHLSVVRLGSDIGRGDRLQAVTPAGTWFGARADEAGGWALVGCTVAPGFDFADFELGDRTALVARYPQHREIIESLTRESGAG